jgi:hypothetical protein
MPKRSIVVPAYNEEHSLVRFELKEKRFGFEPEFILARRGTELLALHSRALSPPGNVSTRGEIGGLQRARRGRWGDRSPGDNGPAWGWTKAVGGEGHSPRHHARVELLRPALVRLPRGALEPVSTYRSPLSMCTGCVVKSFPQRHRRSEHVPVWRVHVGAVWKTPDTYQSEDQFDTSHSDHHLLDSSSRNRRPQNLVDAV